MVRQLDDFLQEWAYESESTLNLFKLIPDNLLALKEHDMIRSIGKLCWHITLTLSEMLNRTGLSIEGPSEDSETPQHIQEIIDAYQTSSQSVLENLKTKWNNEMLNEEVDMYGQQWKKGTVLDVLIKHQAHHRGQLTVLMRYAGLKVSGVYGPSKEEWSQFGMPEME